MILVVCSNNHIHQRKCCHCAPVWNLFTLFFSRDLFPVAESDVLVKRDC